MNNTDEISCQIVSRSWNRDIKVLTEVMKRNGDNHAIPAANLIITFSFSEKKYAELLLLLLVVNNKCCNILNARAAAMQVNTYRFSKMVNSVGEKKTRAPCHGTGFKSSRARMRHGSSRKSTDSSQSAAVDLNDWE